MKVSINDDGYVSPIDVLSIINFINLKVEVGEGESNNASTNNVTSQISFAATSPLLFAYSAVTGSLTAFRQTGDASEKTGFDSNNTTAILRESRQFEESRSQFRLAGVTTLGNKRNHGAGNCVAEGIEDDLLDLLAKAIHETPIDGLSLRRSD